MSTAKSNTVRRLVGILASLERPRTLIGWIVGIAVFPLWFVYAIVWVKYLDDDANTKLTGG